MAKQDTIKYLNEKKADNGDASDYARTPLGVDSENIDRPDGRTGEETFTDLLNGINLGKSLKYEDPFLYLLDGNGDTLSRVTLVLPSHKHEYTVTITKEATYTEPGLKTYTCVCGDSYAEEIPMLVDNGKPSGLLKVGTKTYNTLLENAVFNTYWKEPQEVTIEASDHETGVKDISYYLSDSIKDETMLAGLVWVNYTGSFTIHPNNQYIVYARIIDNADNVTYLCSDGIVLDNIAPVFNGMEDGGTYPTGTILTVQDGETLYVNGVAVELTDHSYTFNVEDNYLLSIIDRAGNETRISISIEHMHNYVDGVCSCGKKEYEEIELTKYNLYMTGLTTSANDLTTPSGELVIPDKFEYEGKKYLTTSVNFDEDFSEDRGGDAYPNVTSLILPDSLTTIKALHTFSRIKSVNIPINVIKFSRKSLVWNCINLETVYFNAKNFPINNDTSGAFRTYGEPQYKMIFGPEVNVAPYIFSAAGNSSGTNANYGISEIEFKNPNTQILEKCFMSMPDLKNVILPSNLTVIENLTFSHTGIESITIPDSVKVIGDSVFYDCENLINVNLNKVETLGLNNFLRCDNLELLDLSNIKNNKYLDSCMFQSCKKSLKTINLPLNLESIHSAFEDCVKLESIVIPKSVKGIYGRAFYNCTSLAELHIPATVKNIEPEAFHNVPHIYYNGTATGAPWGALAMN